MERLEKIKKMVGLDKESALLLKNQQIKERQKIDDSNKRLLSMCFENALILFYDTVDERLEPNTGKITKRQTIYLSPRSNAKFNELAFRHNYVLQDLANIIIKKIYG